jgi:chemotaxis protein MotB
MAIGESRLRLRRGHGSGGGGGHEGAGMMRWLLTYADMITLLLALFIILFAISTISRVKLQRLATEISGGFNSTDSINNPPNGGTTGSETGQTEEANMAAVKSQLERYVQSEHLTSKVHVSMSQAGLVITLLSDKTYYNSGSAELRPETMRLLDEVAGQIRHVRNGLRVEGNTDNIPIATPNFPTNWELSAARATGVTRYLVEHDKIDPTRLSFAGYGQFRPKFPNDTEAHRQQNRRVDIVILNGNDTPQPAPEEDSPTTTTNGGGPNAAASRPANTAVARSDRGPHAKGVGGAQPGAERH